MPLPNGPNITLIAALRPEGFGALLSVNGAVNRAVFAPYLAQALGPSLCLGLADILAGYGARFLYLPPIRRVSIPSNWRLVSSKPGCAPPRRVPVTYLKTLVAPPSG